MSSSDSSSDRKQSKKKKRPTKKRVKPTNISVSKSRGHKKHNKDIDSDSDYERYHKKKKKGNKFTHDIDAEPRKKRNKHFKRSQTVGISLDSDKNNKFQSFYRRKKQREESKESSESDISSNSDTDSDDIPIKIKTKTTSKRQKIRSKTPIPKTKKKKVNETKSRKSEKKTSEKKQKLKSKTPKQKKTKSRSKKSATLVGNDLMDKDMDLSVFALDSKKRDAIKANKNATFGGFKLRINYRYRLDDNRICLCKFVGIPLFAKSGTEYVGMVVEHNGTGEHNGSVQNKSYFRCRDGKGIFVRPYRIIEDLGINTIQLTEQQIDGSAEIKQLIKDIKNGVAVKDKEKKVKKKKKKKENKKRGLKQRSKTVTNLDDKGKWKPPSWVNEIDQDHGYDFLASKPFYSKEHLKKHKYKNKPVSVTAFNAKNNY